MSKSTKKRSSIITIIIVILLLGIIAISVISLLNHISENNEIEEEQYISNLYEEDLMQYEYSLAVVTKLANNCFCQSC